MNASARGSAIKVWAVTSPCCSGQYRQDGSSAATRRLVWLTWSWLVPLHLCLCAGFSIAAAASPAGGGVASEAAKGGVNANTGQAETLLLDIRINGIALPDVVRVERLSDGRLALPRQTWESTRLLVPDGGLLSLPDGQSGYALDAVPGLDYVLDRSQLALSITAPAAAFRTLSLALNKGVVVPPLPSATGVYLNYDLSSTLSSGSGGHYHAAFFEGVAFNSRGALMTGVLARRENAGSGLVRTETWWRTDMPASMRTLIIGDAVGSGGAWSSPVRYGGIRYGRDFSLAPGFISYPIPTLASSAALPSTIEVLVNNQRRASGIQVGSGPFELTNVPVVSGAGAVNLVVRDLRGVETVISQSYYLHPRLLAPGLSDFSIEAGWLRRNFGIAQADYGPAFAAATYRYGLTRGLTMESRLELQKKRQAGGIEIRGVLGTWASARAAAAWSRSDKDYPGSTGFAASGGRMVLGLERSSRAGGGAIQWDYYTRGFRPFGSLIAVDLPRQRLQASAGVPLGKGVSAGASYTMQSTWGGEQFRLAALNFGTSIGSQIYLSVYASKQLGGGTGWNAGLNLVVPLEKQRSVVASSTRNSRGESEFRLQANEPAPPGPGWGWRVSASRQKEQRAQAGVTFNSSHGQISADANFGSDSTTGASNNALRLGARGSVGWFEGIVFASRRIDQGAFAVVRVGDFSGVPVYRSNQLAAVTDGQGLALVTGLLPYQENQLTLDPTELPLDMQIESVRERVIPYARSGLLVNMAVRRSRNALVELRQPGGEPVPAGALVSVSSQPAFIVGRRGEVYLMNLENENRLAVSWKGGSCEIALSLDPRGPSEPRIGPLVCGQAK